jgi:uncharacterized membrane protein
MFRIGDLFQWERFITPSIIKIFYVLAVVIIVLAGLASIVSALLTMPVNPIGGALAVIVTFIAMLAGIIFARLVAELILMVFRINEHLSAIRNRGGI